MFTLKRTMPADASLSFSWFFSRHNHAIEAMREVGGVGVNPVERDGAGRIGVERSPIHKISAALQNVSLSRRCPKLHLKRAASRESRREQVVQRRHDGEYARHRH